MEMSNYQKQCLKYWYTEAIKLGMTDDEALAYVTLMMEQHT
jgi:hypothetical protein